MQILRKRAKSRPEYMQKCYGGVMYLDGAGPSMDNIERLDMNSLPMIHHMENTGLPVDLSHFAEMDKILTADMEEITEKIHKDTGIYINVSSSDQVSDLLFKKLGLKQIREKLTKSGDRESTDYETLVSIQHQHPVVSDILKYKEYDKLRGTYVRPIPKLAKPTRFGEWRLYPHLGITRIPSSRLNCSDPNLLAMPNRTKRGRQVCEGFICPSGYTYLSVDESQVEPRVVTHRSKDEGLRRVYQNDEDIYSDFAIEAFRIPDKRWECKGYGSTDCDNKEHAGHGWHYPGVDKKKHRLPAKTCTLASIYEVSKKGLAEQMPVVCSVCDKEASEHDCGTFKSLWTEEPCQGLINSFYMKYPRILEMRTVDHNRAKKHGFCWDDFGRIWHVTAVRSVLDWVVAAGLREAGNFPIQSTAQGTVKLAMARIMDDFRNLGLLGEIYNPVLQIHDEILGICRIDMAVEVGEYIKDIFQNIVRLSVPIRAEMATAECWGKLNK